MEKKEKWVSSKFTALITRIHEETGYSLRDIALGTNLHHAYIWQILHGVRRPSRDALIVLCSFGWGLDLDTTNQILHSVGYKPLSNTSEPVSDANME